MGTVSDKLTYLNTTKGKIKDAINITSANILSTDTFRSYADKLKEGLVDAINNGTDTIYNNFPKVTGENTEITLNNTYEAPMTSVLKGNTEQTTYTGKNLYDLDTSTQYGAGSGVTITKNNDGSYTLNGRSIGGATFFRGARVLNETHSLSYTSNKISSGVFVRTRNSDITESGLIQDQLNCNDLNRSISSSKEIKYVEISIASGTELNDFRIYPQLEKGSTSTSFEPFVGGSSSPSPDYPQDIRVVTGDNTINVTGKNLFDKNTMTMTNTFVNPEIGSSNGFTSIYTPCTPNTTYTISKAQETSRFYVGTTETLPTAGMTATAVSSSATGTTKTFTTGANANYIVAMVRSSNDTLTEEQIVAGIQVEKNSSATPYQPYISTNYPINLGSIELCKIGDYQDKIRKSTGKNLFDKNNTDVIDNQYLDDDGELTGNNNFYVYPYTEVKPNTIYSVQPYKNYTACYCFYDINKNFISSIRINSINQNFTTPSNCQYLRMSVRKSDINEIQLEEGNQVTEYEPYGIIWYKRSEIGNNIFNNTSVLGIADNQSGADMTSANGTYAILKNNINSNITNNNMYCTFVKYEYNSTIIDNRTAQNNLNNNTFCMRQGTNDRIYFKNSSFEGKTGNQISSEINGEKIYYVLATPTTTEITDTTLINQLEAFATAKSIENTTIISQTNADSPFIISVSALSKN